MTARHITSSPDKHYSLDSEDDFRSGGRNVSHQQQFFSELPSPGRSHYTNYWYSWVQTIYKNYDVETNISHAEKSRSLAKTVNTTSKVAQTANWIRILTEATWNNKVKYPSLALPLNILFYNSYFDCCSYCGHSRSMQDQNARYKPRVNAPRVLNGYIYQYTNYSFLFNKQRSQKPWLHCDKTLRPFERKM